MSLFRYSILVFSLGTLFLFSCKNTPESDKAITTDAQEVTASASGDAYKVDVASSKIEWIGAKVTAHHSGTLPVKSGELTVKDGNLTGGKFTLDMAGIAVTGPAGTDAGMNQKLQGHLLSPDFFDTATHPEATFEVTAVAPFSGTVTEPEDPAQAEISKYKVADPSHTVSGNLTIKGVTKNIQFPAKISITEGGIDALAKFNIDRTQWNVVYPGKPDDLIRKEVYLGLALKAGK